MGNCFRRRSNELDESSSLISELSSDPDPPQMSTSLKRSTLPEMMLPMATIETKNFKPDAVGKVFKAYGLKDEVFEWEEMGITIHTPAGIVPIGTKYCTITVTPVIPKNCIFPANSVLVSGIFDITTSFEIQMSVKIELEHSVVLSAPEDLKAITFAKTNYHHFTLCMEGEFTVGSQYGVLECKTFSKIGIFLKELFHIPIRCSVQLLYAPSSNQVHAVFTQNIRRLMQLAIACDDFQGCERKGNTRFVFSSNRITVEINNKSEDQRWNIKLLKLPFIEKDEVIHFNGRQLTPEVGFCFEPVSQQFSGQHKFNFSGATEYDLFLLLNCRTSEGHKEDRAKCHVHFLQV